MEFLIYRRQLTADVRDETILGRAGAFDAMQLEFKTLEYWSMFTLLGENLAECYMRTGDIGPDLLESVCTRAELPDCAAKDWKRINKTFKNYNANNKEEKGNAKLATYNTNNKEANGNSQEMSWGSLRTLQNQRMSVS